MLIQHYKGIVKDARAQWRPDYREANPDIDVATKEYEDGVKYAIRADNKILFLKFHVDFLKDKLDEVESEDFPGLFEVEETGYSTKMKLVGSSVKLVPRSTPTVDKSTSMSSFIRMKKEKKSSIAAFYDLLSKGNYPSAKYHNKTVNIRCSITFVKVPAVVSISGLKDVSNSDQSNIPVEDLLEWKIGVDKMQCDMYVDTEMVVAIFKLASFGLDKDLFSAPLDRARSGKSIVKK